MSGLYRIRRTYLHLSSAWLIRDMETGRHVVTSGEVSEDGIHSYDFQSPGYLAGSRIAGRWNLFHAPDNAMVELIQAEPARALAT